ncbi:T-cell leukemia/lymphoma protein 1A isoform X1 [Papio anubis]|uniref:T-cell leukemia/lymphoma protein 1A isoform X1 n=1 Tax=Papio anubis TaxID=9555 RepID=UPI0012AD2882|nr:T-cell leukemia/lymphoma protein 1A isoform X1 [Papio anubis]XP_031523728.1 T-cell leukemia/lymphoma protein 1A isoform X1 [Papio anubis]
MTECGTVSQHLSPFAPGPESGQPTVGMLCFCSPSFTTPVSSPPPRWGLGGNGHTEDELSPGPAGPARSPLCSPQHYHSCQGGLHLAELLPGAHLYLCLSFSQLADAFQPLSAPAVPHSTPVSCCTPTQLRELVRTQPIHLSRASETPDQWSHMVLCLQTLPEHRFRCSSRKGLKGALVCAQDSEAFASVVHSPGRSRRPGRRALWTNPQNPWLAHVEKG